MTNTGCRLAAGILGVVLLAVPAAAQNAAPQTPVVAAPVQVDTGRLRGPRQPIFFRHDLHAGQYQMPCLYCHYSATVSSEPGIPTLKTCMGCHQLVAGSTPANQAQIKKVREAWSNRVPPEWTRIHALPGFVHFPHMRHIKVLGSNSCTTCHGDVAGMTQVYQFSTLKMGWCIRCHVERKVTRDCSVCHY